MTEENSQSNENKTFCVMPWFNLSTETNGKCKICCVVMTDKYIKKDDGSDFHIQQDDVEDIWNSKYLRDVRKKMLKGEKVSDCFYCNNKEESGIESPRTQYNQRWLSPNMKDVVKKSEGVDGQVEQLPRSLEPRPGITCNLKCNMCWSLSSSKILSERKRWLAKDKENPIPDFLKPGWEDEVKVALASDFKWADNDIYQRNLEKCIPTLERLYFTGGEPVLIRSNIRSLEKLVELGKTDTLVAFTTNLTQVEDSFFDLLKKFSKVEVTGSIDGLAAANDYIRYPSEWKIVTDNLLKLHSYDNIELSVFSVVQMSNILSILDFYQWVIDQKLERQIPVVLTILHYPEYLRLNTLDDQTRHVARKKLDSLLGLTELSDQNRDHLEALKSHLDEFHPRASQMRTQFCEFTQFLDRSRGTDFLKSFPEFAHVSEFQRLRSETSS